MKEDPKNKNSKPGTVSKDITPGHPNYASGETGVSEKDPVPPQPEKKQDTENNSEEDVKTIVNEQEENKIVNDDTLPEEEVEK